MSGPPVLVIGDVHGCRDALVTLMRDAGLIDRDLRWSGEETTVWFAGDFFDRGPDGVGSLELVMRLQDEAARAGGRVAALLGNHEVLILAARKFGEGRAGGPGGSFVRDWIANGGQLHDLERLEDRHVEWVLGLPALANADDALLLHADSVFYTAYGDGVEDVNDALRAVLAGDDASEWDRLLSEFARRHELEDATPGSSERVAGLLERYGGDRLIHGHTPIPIVSGRAPESITGPLVYQNGRCVNVDAGLFLGAPGFIYRLR